MHMMNSLPERPFTGFYLLILVLLLTPARSAHSEATSADLQQSRGGPVPVTEAGTEIDQEGARLSGPVTPSMSSVSGTAPRETEEERKDLTGFFVIGMVLNILLLMLFLIWAVGQWRKTRK